MTMLTYATYEFYATDYHGTVVPEAEFSRAAWIASRKLDALCFDRVNAVIVADVADDDIERIKMATCAVADEIYKDDENDGQDGIQSERTGNYSVTFATGSQKLKSLDTKISDSAALYLSPTGLMFRGFTEDEL